MKHLVVLLIFFAPVKATFAQTINKPLFVLFHHNKMILNAGTLKGFNNLPPLQIKSLNVFSDSIKTEKYGPSEKNGVFEIYLDDEKYPNALDSLLKGTFKKTHHPTDQDYKNYKDKIRH